MGAGAAHVVALALVLPVMITLPVPTETGSRLVAVRVALATAAPDPMDRAITTAEEPEGVSGEGDIDDPAWSAPNLPEVTGALPTIVEEAAPPRHAARPEPEALPEDAASPDAASPQGPALASPVAAAAAAPPMAPLKAAALEGALELEEARIQNAPAPALAGDVALETIASLAPADFVEADEVEETYETAAVDGTVPVPLRKPPKTTAAEAESAAVNAVQAPRAIATPSPNRQVYERKPQARGFVNQQQQPVFKGILGGRRATTMQEYRTPGG